MLTADELLTTVRVYGDRVHDAVRRLGCGAEAAVQVVQASALDLLNTVAHQPETVSDPVGWWFARARSLGRKAAGGDDALPLGGGVLSSDANQVRLAEALEARPERDRAALLLRDSYDLPAGAVGAALGLDAGSAMEVVGQARLAFLPMLTETRLPRITDHPDHLGPLARLAEGGQHAAREGATRRHAQGCDTCSAVLDAQERARRLLSGLTVVALPDDARERLLATVESRARALLPAAPPMEEEEWDDAPHRGYSLSLMTLGLVAAVGIGGGIGALASRDSGGGAAVGQGSLPLITAAPVLRVGPASPAAGGTPSSSPSPHVFLVTPSPTPTPSVSPTGTPSPTEQPLALELDPSSGPRDSEVTVTGQGWIPGAEVTIEYVNAVGGAPGATQTVIADPEGSFVTTITAHDSGIGPGTGPHDVRANDGTHQMSATFVAMN